MNKHYVTRFQFQSVPLSEAKIECYHLLLLWLSFLTLSSSSIFVISLSGTGLLLSSFPQSNSLSFYFFIFRPLAQQALSHFLSSSFIHCFIFISLRLLYAPPAGYDAHMILTLGVLRSSPRCIWWGVIEGKLIRKGKELWLFVSFYLPALAAAVCVCDRLDLSFCFFFCLLVLLF